METARVSTRHWLILAVSVLVAAASAATTAGAAFLLPALHTDLGLGLAQAGALVAMPSVGTAITLVAWGWLVDRTGERIVLVTGSALTAAALIGAVVSAEGASAQSGSGGSTTWALALFLLLAGAAAASANSASGRLVVGWFPAHRRGLAMGIRQMSQPLGAAIAAVAMPTLAGSRGIGWALGVPLAMAAVSTVAALVVVDPPRPARGGATAGAEASPYRRAGYLQRIHGVSVLLVLPQALMQSYLLVWLVVGHGWAAGPAGVVVMAAQLLGALGRIAAGWWSDRLGSRMRPLRQVAVAGVIGSAALAAAEAAAVPGGVAVALAVVVSVIVVADNGLAFTAVAEYAGPFWSGRALGVQNTAQFLAVAAATPLFALVIEGAGYWSAFAAAAAVAGLAALFVPRADRSR